MRTVVLAYYPLSRWVQFAMRGAANHGVNMRSPARAGTTYALAGEAPPPPGKTM